MAIPGVLSGGAAASAASAIGAPVLNALEAVAKALVSIAEAAKAVIPLLAVMSDQFKELGEKFKNTFRIYIGEPLVAALKGLNSAVKFALPTSLYEGIGGALAKVGAALGATGKAFLSVAGAAPVVAGAVAALGLAMVGLVAKANPAVAEQFNLALNDMMAVIGQALVPIMQVVIQVVRLFADALQSFAGTIGGALGSIFESLMPLFEVLADVFARVGQAVGAVLQFIAPFIKIVAEGIRTIFEWIGRAVKWVLSLIGIEIGDSPIKKGAAVGAAVRQANKTGVEDVISTAQKAAFSLGTASGKNYAEITANNTNAIIGELKGVASILAGLPGAIGEVIRNPFKAVGDAWDKFREGKKIEGELPGLRAEGERLDAIIAENKMKMAMVDLARGLAGAGPHPRAKIALGRKEDGAGVVKAGEP